MQSSKLARSQLKVYLDQEHLLGQVKISLKLHTRSSNAICWSHSQVLSTCVLGNVNWLLICLQSLFHGIDSALGLQFVLQSNDSRSFNMHMISWAKRTWWLPRLFWSCYAIQPPSWRVVVNICVSITPTAPLLVSIRHNHRLHLAHYQEQESSWIWWVCVCTYHPRTLLPGTFLMRWTAVS